MERIGLEPGTEVGGYTIVSPLGTGAMGAVYRAVDGEGNVVAFKVLHAHIAADAEMRERLNREIAALRKVHHPAVAHLIDAEAEASDMFIVTELVDGPTLEAEIADGGPLEPVDLFELADQLADALDAVHDAGVIHRDLKPSNVLISPEGPVLIDFGISHGLEDARMTSVGFVMGTPGYLAPELIDRGDPSPTTDWWGWAAMLVFAATGRAPFGVRPLDAVISRAHSGDPDTDGLGPLTTAALRGALDANPARRWSAERVVSTLRVAAEKGDLAPAGGADLGTQVIGPPATETEVVDAAAFAAQTAAEDGGGWSDETGAAGDPAPALGAAATTALAGGAAAWGHVQPDPTVAAGAPGGSGTAVMPQSMLPQDRTPPQTLAEYLPAHDLAPPAPAQPQVQQPPQQPLPPSYQPGLPAGPAYDIPAPVEGWGAPPPAGVQGAHEAAPDGYSVPEVRRRPWPLLAFALPVALAGATYPAATVVIVLVLVVLCRFVGTVHSTFHERRELRGVRGSDTVTAVARSPWHLLRAIGGTIPSVLVAVSAVLVLAGPVWWALRTDRLLFDATGSGGGTGPHGENEPWVYAVLLGAATLLAVVLLWFGPFTSTTRHGARVILNKVAPGQVGTAAIVVVALLLAWLFLSTVLSSHPVDWSPLQEPPRFDT